MKKSILVFAIILISSFTSINQYQKKIVTDEKTDLIDKYITELAAKDGFSGAILVAKNGKVLLKKAFGYAHLGLKVKNNINTKFNYASIGKTFTSVAIFQLIQEERLSLTDNIGKYLAEYPNKTIRDSVTITHLLTHTSGVPNYFAKKKFLESSKTRFRTMEDLSPLYENEPMESKPGEIFSYRNTNYLLLGRIIEKITGLSYDEYVAKRIFFPLSMRNTGNFDIDHVIENAAEGYTTSNIYPNKYQLNTFMGTVRGSSAGGGYTTLDDLYQFAEAIKNSRLLNETYTDILTKPLNKKTRYGYGLSFTNPEKGTIYGHSGGHFGVGSEWRVYEDEVYTVILLTNRDAGQGFMEARFFVQRLISGSTPSIDTFFFTKKVIETCIEKGYKTASELISARTTDLSENDLNSKGYELLHQERFDLAIDMFKLEALAFPKSYYSFDSLGEAYMKNGKIDLAILNYKKSLKLNPENNNAKEMIKKMKRK
ncbi:serine hydrolase [Aquimarina sp. W85]|uniref:serine hydrolase n=1 Tax=Aquimarina rhodophyticola TaxID=3342246 RepID=UPI00366C7EC0